MTPAQMLRWWLRGLRATAVAVDEALTQRRLHARLTAESEATAAEFRRRGDELKRHFEDRLAALRHLEALWERPTVEPDYRRHVRPDAPTHEAAAWWLATVWPSTWGREPDLYRWCVANALLARREMADAGELVS